MMLTVTPATYDFSQQHSCYVTRSAWPFFALEGAPSKIKTRYAGSVTNRAVLVLPRGVLSQVGFTFAATTRDIGGSG